MPTAIEHTVTLQQAQTFLSTYFKIDPPAVDLAGEGAWSRCFGFQHGEEDFVIRFGRYVDDFQTDREAYAYTAPDLPIPEVLDIGQAFDGNYAISRRAFGVPLESLSASAWLAVIPSLVSALEAMRVADISATDGFGGWGLGGQAPFGSWSDFLLVVAEDNATLRTHGWRARMATSPEGEAAFIWGFDLLCQSVDDAVPRCLLHRDLINRNVLVQNDHISGVFDWGCSVYGDHLYDLAWFDFWAPWYPQLNMHLLSTALERRWREVGYAPEEKERRLRVCYLHIGLDHLAYNGWLGDWAALVATAERMRTLVQQTL